jgi:hypothetical protein
MAAEVDHQVHRPQAKDVDAKQFLGIVYDLNVKENGWAMRFDVEDTFSPRFPKKVLMAKAQKLIDQGLMRGCACGCRGDYVVEREGCDLIGRPYHGIDY